MSWQSDAAASVQRAVEGLLLGEGFTEDMEERQGVAQTGERWCRALVEMTRGYTEDPAQILHKRFASTYDELILVRDVEFNSLCEHHLLPFTGRAHVAYLPGDGGVCGLSKLARLVECFARRLQIQERMTNDIAHAIQEQLKPRGSACIVEATHSCMACRGVRKTATMTTSTLLGRFRDRPELRAELFGMIRG